MEHGCDINTEDAEGMSPLHLAVEQALGDVVRHLVEGGANINAQRLGWTPLHIAVDEGDSLCRVAKSESDLL